MEAHRILDVVELRSDAGGWPAGTTGTVVEATSDRLLIEISDDGGRGLDFITLPRDAVAPPTSTFVNRATP
jgi:chemotaxis protein histidine kinase CheA